MSQKNYMLLNGIDAPSGNGVVIEVHLDIMAAPLTFLNKLNNLGFESDPFADFYPPQYTLHYTGRTRAAQSEVAKVLDGIDGLIGQVFESARASNVRLYVESELVREIHRFEESASARNLSVLDDFKFREIGHPGKAKADIHVEFRSGTVSPEVRRLLIEKSFYWVRTPASNRFPSEEIATLQASVFHDAKQVYSRLVARPLPGCTGIHLEQKLAMIASYPNLPMPMTVEIMKTLA